LILIWPILTIVLKIGVESHIAVDIAMLVADIIDVVVAFAVIAEVNNVTVLVVGELWVKAV